ncbi:MAG: hypothetical protein E7541_01335 [Ruminococcaceae bacterium]|nr:hypothetical protein [Oscillospiraceae bacterium]
MSEFFLEVVNRSLAAGWIVPVILLLRLLLRKVPRWITVMLWAVVAVRLICPFTLESAMSLLPSAEVIPPATLTETTPQIHTGIPFVNQAVNPLLESTLAPAPGDSVTPLQIGALVAAVLWLVGVAVLLLYTVVSFWRLRRRVATAVRLQDNIYQSEQVVSPFVLGIVRPRVYLPFALTPKEQAYVIAHETAHIRRRDHWWKPLGFLLLTINWFNPLLWVGYVFLCRDIELACDEKVVRGLDREQKADYSQALLACSVHRRSLAACPLAFGEVGVKARVRSVLSYKKPAFWVIVVALLVSAAVAVCFLTDPLSAPEEPTPMTEEPVAVTSEAKLRDTYPHFFDLDASGGLTVFVWEIAEGQYRCYLMDTLTVAISDMNYAFTNGCTIGEMRAILDTYSLSREQISVQPVRNPLSSYYYEVDDAYIRQVIERFWGTESSRVVSSEADYDVDGDGKAEHLVVTPGPTAGLFSLCVNAYRDGILVYSNTFLLGPGAHHGFIKESDGRVWLWTSLMEDDAPSRHRIGVEKGQLYLENTFSERAAYWGTQGVDASDWGLMMQVRPLSNTQLEIVFTHDATWVQLDGELSTGYAYDILKITDNGDMALYSNQDMVVSDSGETALLSEQQYAWDDGLLRIKKNDVTVLTENVETIYGPLDSGRYCLQKVVFLTKADGIRSEQIWRATFEIS